MGGRGIDVPSQFLLGSLDRLLGGLAVILVIPNILRVSPFSELIGEESLFPSSTHPLD